ncbi:MAG: phosphoribosyltransferase family protein [Gemmatimonadetes bacterium]|nr:phosphoribosyltransferase family protein [Gemmatimonadota bacterium]
MTGELLRSLERLLLPNSCLVCERLVERDRPDDLLCAVCRWRFRRVGVGCERCAHPLPPVGPCRFCTDWPAALGRTRSAVWLTNEARVTVHALKYDGYTRAAEIMAEAVASHVLHPEVDVLVPVPLGRRRLRSRGYNQAAALCRALSRAWGIPMRDGVLERTRETRSQTELTPEERSENVRAAFQAKPPDESSGKRAAIVDDVLTTGATLCAIAETMAGTGWIEVNAITFARAQTYESKVLLG